MNGTIVMLVYAFLFGVVLTVAVSPSDYVWWILLIMFLGQGFVTTLADDLDEERNRDRE